MYYTYKLIMVSSLNLFKGFDPSVITERDSSRNQISHLMLVT